MFGCLKEYVGNLKDDEVQNSFISSLGVASVPVAKLLCLLMLFLGWHSTQSHILVQMSTLTFLSLSISIRSEKEATYSRYTRNKKH